VLGETPRPPRAPVDVSRQSLDLRLRNWQFLQSSWQSATFGGGLTLQRYGSGEERVLLDSSFRHQLRLGRALTLETHYSYREPFGDPAPLDFDRVDASERVNETVRYQTPEVLASVTAGYDFRTQTPTDPRIRFRLTPGPAFRLDLHARYRLSESELEYIVGTAEWTPTEAVALKLGGKYLPAAGVFERADGVIELQHGPWSLSYGGIYRGLQGVFERGNLAVTRDLGCRAVTFFMNQTRQE